MARTAIEIQDLIDQASTRVANLNAEIQALALVDEPTDGQLERSRRQFAALDKATAERDALTKELADVVRSTQLDAVKDLIRSGRGGTEDGDGASVGGTRRVRRDPDDQVISRALRHLEQEGGHLSPDQGDRLDGLLRAGKTEDYQPSYIAERLLITETDAYRSAFMRVLQAGQRSVPAMLTHEEAGALRAYEELERRYVARAASEGTTTAGGFGVPVMIDPTIIVTSGAADAPILNVCRIEPLTNNIWKGVSSAGMSWSYDAEASQVSDDAPTLAQPSVTVYMPRGFIPYSIEVGMDYPGFASEMSMLLRQGYLDLVASQTTVGFGGTTSPRGIFTACAANTTACQVVTTTDGSFGGVDVFKAWNALSERYRSRATWVMSVSVESAIRQFASAAGSSSSYFTVDLTADGLSKINGRPVIVTDYAPSFTSGVPGTTGAANVLVVGAFDNYLMANRAGMSIEAVPILVGANQRPTGQRGLFAWSRHGFDSINDGAFKILQNT